MLVHYILFVFNVLKISQKYFHACFMNFFKNTIIKRNSFFIWF